ncbi:MAG: peptide ABC transporter substrate-binding protein [Gudongella sp.]|nr:peptide ABC transporter substrate-binding protein [Gudongella sp.]
MKKNRVLYFLLVIILAVVITGCEGGYDPLGETNKTPSVEYIIYENAELSLPLTSFNSLNPLYIENSSYFYFSKLIYEGLFEYDEKLEPMPCLASTYTMGEDGKSIDLTLKEGVKFHNGQVFSSKDVIFTIEMMKKSGDESYYKKLNQAGLLSTNQIISAKQISENRLTISFKEPCANILDILTFPIIPESKVDAALEIDDFIPIGTGPYKYVENNKFKEIYLKANEDYRNGEPEISHISGKIFQDEESILTAFETGKINIAKTSGIDWDKYESNKRISIYEFVSNEYIALAFNHEKELFSIDGSKGLKRAILYGIDRQSIIEKVYLKHATQIDTPVNPISYLYSEEALTYGYSKDKALEILDKSGYIDSNNDGIREDLSGNDLTFKMLVTINNNLEIKAVNMIKSYLKDIGIVLNISEDIVEYDELGNLPKELLLGDYDMAFLGWQQSIIPRYNYMLDSNMVGTSNYSFYQDDDMDMLLNNLDISWDIEQKKDLMNKFQNNFVENIPYASLYFKNGALLVDDFIEGPLDPNYYNIYNGLEKCYIKMSIK